jgi:serine/threonine protein kinase
VKKAQRFGRYILLDKVAAGGMAEVWRAKLQGEGQFQRIIAIKKILSHVSEDAEFIQMFTDEANITVQLQHPNIGQVYEFNKLEEIFYISMEYISGKDLKTVWSHRRQRRKLIPMDISCYVIQKMAEGLDYAHNKRDNFGNPLGIVHRDVSPQNVLLSWDGQVKVIDFGIAKANDKSSRTRAGTLKGKFAYMSPEQIRGLPLTGQADIFALGVVLYELLTGERGFSAESEFSLLEKVRNVEIKPPTMINADIPPELEKIVFKALAKKREERYQRGQDFAEDLQRYLLMKGKPPGPTELGDFLRQNFTVDYDKERLRLESYKEVEVEPEPEASLPPNAATEAAMPAVTDQMLQQNRPLDAVRAALAQEVSGGNPAAPGAFAQGPNNQSTSGGYALAPYRDQTGAGATGITPVTATGIRPPLDRTNIRNMDIPPPPGGGASAVKIAAIVVVALLVLGGAAVGALFALGVLGGSGSILLTVEGPSEAKVRVDGKESGVAAPSLTIENVSSGQHIVVAEADGYKPFTSAPIVVSKGKMMQLTATMRRVGGSLAVSSNPSGGIIFLNGQDTKRRTPYTFPDVESGVSHSVEVRRDDYKPARQDSVQLKPGEQSAVSFDLKPAAVTLIVDSVPQGAVVMYKDEEQGTTPMRLKVDPGLGDPQLELLHAKRRCNPYSTTVGLTGVGEQDIKVTLKGCRR